MGGYRTAPAVLLIDANGRPVGFKEFDGDEIMFATLSDDQASLVLPDGSTVLMAATGAAAVAAEILPPNSLVYITATGQIGLADATAEGKEAIGFVKSAVPIGESAAIYGEGSVITGLAGLTPGASYFMSTTPGGIGAVPVATGNVVLRVGTALSATQLAFALYNPITL